MRDPLERKLLFEVIAEVRTDMVVNVADRQIRGILKSLLHGLGDHLLLGFMSRFLIPRDSTCNNSYSSQEISLGGGLLCNKTFRLSTASIESRSGRGTGRLFFSCSYYAYNLQVVVFDYEADNFTRLLEYGIITFIITTLVFGKVFRDLRIHSG